VQPLHRITSLTIDTAAEARKIIASQGSDAITDADHPLGKVYRVYRNLKTLGFFSLVAGRFGNKEATRDMSLRVYDIYEVSTGRGRLFFVVEASREAIEAFLDDGFVLLKVRDWLADAYRRVCMAGEVKDPSKAWDDAFHAPGSPLPPGVMVIPFYNKNLTPGVPGVILVLVKEMRPAKA
jgi:hypothetical protein